MSKSSQALKMFEEGNTPVQVAIKLDMETLEVDRLYREYWKLAYAELKGNIFSFVEIYQLTKKQGLTQQEVIDALKIAEEIPSLQAERRYIEDCIDDDGPKILELKRQKDSLLKELRSILEEVESAREYRNNQLKAIKEELELANNELKLEQEKLDRQKASLASEVDKYKESLANEVATAQEHAIHELNNSKECLLALREADNQLTFIQKEVDRLKQEEQELTIRIERLKIEVQQEQYVQPQLVYQQLPQEPGQQETPKLSEEELRRLAIPLICYNWESRWGELMHQGLHGRESMSEQQ